MNIRLIKTKFLKIVSLSFLIVLISSSLFAQLQQDSEYGFKINVPSNWSKNSYMDGTDKVYDYMSHDENAAVQLRVFEAGADFTTDLLAQVYEESMLAAATQKLSLEEYTTVNGIPCKKGIYLLDYNGNEVGLSAIYIVQNNKGYVLTALIPSNMIQQKGEELKGVVNSFSIEGFQANPNTAKQKKKPSGLGGLMGSPANNNNNQQNDSDSGTTNQGGSSNKDSSFGSENLVYQGQTYRTVKIGNQLWMAENLNVGTIITKEIYSNDNGLIEKHCLFDKVENCDKYGGLYQWKEMMQYENMDPREESVKTQGICPPGWHIPSDNEWKVLEGTIDGQFAVGDPEWDKENEKRGSDAGLKLRSNSGWEDYGNGTDNNGIDSYGFNVLPAGGSRGHGMRPSSYGGNGMWGKFWTSKANGGFLCFSRYFHYLGGGIDRYLTGEKFGLSVRCVKD